MFSLVDVGAKAPELISEGKGLKRAVVDLPGGDRHIIYPLLYWGGIVLMRRAWDAINEHRNGGDRVFYDLPSEIGPLVSPRRQMQLADYHAAIEREGMVRRIKAIATENLLGDVSFLDPIHHLHQRHREQFDKHMDEIWGRVEAGIENLLGAAHEEVGNVIAGKVITNETMRSLQTEYFLSHLMSDNDGDDEQAKVKASFVPVILGQSILPVFHALDASIYIEPWIE